MTAFIESPEMFKHHQPIPVECMRGLTISGTNGAFQELVRASGEDPCILTVGVGVEINQVGEILGTRLLMCGDTYENKISTADLFPDANDHGKAVFLKTNIGNWTMPNGRMTSYWSKREDNALNWSIKMATGGRSKTIKFPKHPDYGFGDLVFRVSVQPTSSSQFKVSLSTAPVGGDGLEKLPQWNSRKFPVITLDNRRARIFPKEEVGQRFGLGFQPIFIIRGSEPGELDLEAITYPTSMAVKEAAVLLLQSSTKPNEKLNARKWKEAIEEDDFVAEKTTLLWPAPRPEDDQDTSDSCASEDTEGECTLYT